MHEIVGVYVNFGDKILLREGVRGENVKLRENFIFLKNGKNSKNCRNGSGKPENFLDLG